MKFLAFDTSQEYLTVIAQNQDLTYTVYKNDFQHSTTLMNAVEECLEKTNMRLCDVDFVATCVGAGSFTGIRIGIATAKGLCAPFGKKVLNVTSFDTIAYTKQSGKYLAVINARHNNFYVAGYTDGKLSIEPQFITLEHLNQIKGYQLISSAPIDGLETEVADVKKGLYNAVIAKKDCLIDAKDLAPLYLRLSQAEEGRK